MAEELEQLQEENIEPTQEQDIQGEQVEQADQTTPQPPSKASKLYNNLLNDGYTKQNLGSESDFIKMASTKEGAAKLHENLLKDGYTEKNLGDLNSFMANLVPQPPAQKQAPLYTAKGFIEQEKKKAEEQLLPVPPQKKETVKPTTAQRPSITQYDKKEDEGGFMSALGTATDYAKHLYNKILDGVGYVASGALETQAATTSALINAAQQITGDKGFNSQEFQSHINNEIAPKIKEKIKLAEANVPKESQKKFDDSFLLSSIAGLAEFAPAMPLGVAGMLAAGTDMGIQAINSSEAGKKLPESVKSIFGIATGTATALLTELKLDKIFGKQTEKVAAKLAVETLDGLLKKSTEPITADAFNVALQNTAKSLKDKVVSTGGKMLKAGAVGSMFGGLNESTNLLAEDITNRLTNQDVFEPTSFGKAWTRISKGTASMGVGGVVLGGLHVPFAKTENYIKNKVSESKSIDDINNLKREVTQQVQGGDVSVDNANRVLDLIDHYTRINSSIPVDVPNREKVVDKIKQRDDLHQQANEILTDAQNLDPAFQEQKIKEAQALTNAADDIHNQIAGKPVYKIGEQEVDRDTFNNYLDSEAAKGNKEDLYVENDNEMSTKLEKQGGKTTIDEESGLPVTTTKPIQYDTENIPGLPSKIGGGQEPIQTQPIEGGGTQATSDYRDIQKESEREKQEKLNNLFNLPLSEVTADSPNRLSTDFLNNVLIRDSASPESYSQLDIPTRLNVFSRVLRLIEDDKIFNSIVPLIPIDVMNKLASKEFPADMLLHDKSMFIRSLSINNFPDIVSSIISTIKRSPALRSAEGLDATSRRGFEIINSAINANDLVVPEIPSVFLHDVKDTKTLDTKQKLVQEKLSELKQTELPVPSEKIQGEEVKQKETPSEPIQPTGEKVSGAAQPVSEVPKGQEIKAGVQPSTEPISGRGSEATTPVLEKGEKVKQNKDTQSEFTTSNGRQKVNRVGDELVVTDAKTGEKVSRKTHNKAVREYIDNFDFTHGEEGESTTQSEDVNKMLTEVVESSNNPQQIAEIYAENDVPFTETAMTKDGMIAEYGLGDITLESYRRYGDINKLTRGIRANYFAKKGGISTTIDSLAKEISEHYFPEGDGTEITPQDIVDFMEQYDTRKKLDEKFAPKNPLLDLAKQKFKKLTGIELTREVADKAFTQKIEKETQAEQNLLKQDYENAKQLEDEYWKQYKATDGFTKEAGVVEVDKGKEGVTEEGAKVEELPKDFTSEGGNKAVDEKGEPINVYHGSNKQFDEFNNEGLGTFFTSDKETAEGYRKKYNEGKGVLYEAKVSIKNPVIIDANGKSWDKIEVETDSMTPEKIKLSTNQILQTIRGLRFPKIFHNLTGEKPKPDGLIIKNVIDPLGGLGKPIDIFVPFDASQIRTEKGAKVEVPLAENPFEKVPKTQVARDKYFQSTFGENANKAEEIYNKYKDTNDFEAMQKEMQGEKVAEQPPVPPVVEKPKEEMSSEEEKWTAIRKEKLEEIKGVKEMFEKQTSKSWTKIQQEALEGVAKEFPRKTLSDAIRTKVERLAAKYDAGEDYNPTAKDLAVIQEFKRQTESRITAAKEDLLSDNDAERFAAISEMESYQNDLMNASKALFVQEAGRAFGFRQSESTKDENAGLQIRRMQLMKANGMEKLSDADNKFLESQWEKEKELMKREQEIKEKSLKEAFDNEVAKLQEEYEAKLKEKKISAADKKASDKLRKFAEKVRNSKTLDSLGLGAPIEGETKGISFNTKEALAKVIDKMADGMDKIEAITKVLKEYGLEKSKEFSDLVDKALIKIAKPDTEETLSKIKDLAEKAGEKNVTNEMVAKGLIKDYINSFIGEVDKSNVLNEAATKLKEVLPDLDKRTLRSAFLKEGEFKQPTKKSLNEALNQAKRDLLKIEKEQSKKEATEDELQKKKLEQEKEKAQKSIKDYQKKLDNGEFEKEEPIVLKKQDAELIQINKEKNQIKSEFDKKRKELEEKNKHWLQRAADFARSTYIAALIGSPVTLAKVAYMSVIRPASEITRKVVLGNLFKAIAPSYYEAALRGGESASLKSIEAGLGAYFKQMGEKKMQEKFQKSSNEFDQAAKKYYEAVNAKADEKTLSKLKQDMDNKRLAAMGNIVYQFIGGSSIKDAIQSLVNRANEVERQFGKTETESIKDGNALDKLNYILGFVGRSHSAAKTFSGRFSYAAGFMARLEGAARDGSISDPNRIIEIAHESYIDWERGKYQQDNWVTKKWNDVVRSIKEKTVGKGEWSKYDKALEAILKTDVAITRVPVNIIHEAVTEYTLGALRAPVIAYKEYNKAKGKATEEGYSKTLNSKEFKSRVKELISQMDAEQAAKIYRLFTKGGLGAGLYGLALATGLLQFGVFPHKGQKKKKEEEYLKEGELNPGQVMFGKDRLGETASKLIEHTPSLWTTFMGLGIAKIYADDVKEGKISTQAAWDAAYTHMKIIESSIPQTKVISPLETIKQASKSFAGKLSDYGMLDNYIDSKGAFINQEKKKLEITTSEVARLKDYKVEPPRLGVRSQNKIEVDAKHPKVGLSKDGKPYAYMNDFEWEKFNQYRKDYINNALKEIYDAADGGDIKLTQENLTDALTRITKQATTIAKNKLIEEGLLPEKNKEDEEDENVESINSIIKDIYKEAKE